MAEGVPIVGFGDLAGRGSARRMLPCVVLLGCGGCPPGSWGPGLPCRPSCMCAHNWHGRACLTALCAHARDAPACPSPLAPLLPPPLPARSTGKFRPKVSGPLPQPQRPTCGYSWQGTRRRPTRTTRTPRGRRARPIPWWVGVRSGRAGGVVGRLKACGRVGAGGWVGGRRRSGRGMGCKSA